MRIFRTILCVLFLIAASMAPAAALPMCEKVNNRASVSNTADTPHCSGSSDEASTQSLPPSTDATKTTNPPHQGGCCCDGDMGSACKTHCKTVSGAAALMDARIHNPDFIPNYVSGLNMNYTTFIFEIITPPPKSCV